MLLLWQRPDRQLEGKPLDAPGIIYRSLVPGVRIKIVVVSQ